MTVLRISGDWNDQVAHEQQWCQDVLFLLLQKVYNVSVFPNQRAKLHGFVKLYG